MDPYVKSVKLVSLWCPTLCIILLRMSFPGPTGWASGWNREVSLRCVGGPAVRTEAFLRSEGADIFVPVGAIEQVAAETLPGLPRVLLDHRHGAVRLGAAGVQAVLPGVHAPRGQQEGGPLLDGGFGLDDALPDGVEVAHTRVNHVAYLVRLVLLELLAEFFQQLLHPWYFGFEVWYRQRASVDMSGCGQQHSTSEQQPGMLRPKSHVVHAVRRPLPLPSAGVRRMRVHTANKTFLHELFLRYTNVKPAV